jgi:hypothetical protein
VRSTLKERVAGVASTLPEASRARTANVCAPSGSTAVVCGEVQTANAAPSTRHSNVPGSLAENVYAGLTSLIAPSGPDSITVSGAPASTTNTCEAGVWSALPAPSTARTKKVCSPSSSGSVVCRDEQRANAAASTRHSNVAPASEENANSGV